ncbi:benzoate/H(+) symporter BenE family transporter [Desulfogranum japonicum]|uniref:benzoate/H(+) symporter BenE family transporter n=1 Tax=Desulfogranum japonicum TaxID=231447 RepID=UPI000427345B|nr:benzoate/H(+) symporter BenE family transporter [Desulfogranum japonicum]
MRKKREYGARQPGIPMGPLTLRIPFIHYRFEIADYLQGLLMCTVCLAIIPVLTGKLGMSFEVALAIVIMNGTLYLAHVTFGDPVIPGWVTPAIPLLIAYVETFAPGVERMQALIAFELTFGLFCVFLGITGLAKRFVRLIPNAVQSAILMGAGFSAVILVFKPGEGLKSFDSNPWTITICIGIAFYLLFSEHFKKLRRENKFMYYLGNLGMMPALALAIVVGPLLGELSWPTYDGNIITHPDFQTLFKEFTIFGNIPFPSLKMFITGLPMVISSYVVVFGDVIQSQALLDDAQKYRPDEEINYNPNRSHIIFGARNSIMSIIGPDISMCGPLWAAMQVVVCERYKHGPKAMESIYGGAASFRFGTWTGYFLAPIVSTVKPILGVGLASTMLIQGYVSVRVGVLKSRGFNDLGIAGVAGAILATRGAAWGLGSAIILTVLIYLSNFRKAYEKEEPIFPMDSPDAIAKEIAETMKAK